MEYNIDSKELPLVTPPIIGRLHIAFPLAIILTKEQNYTWFYSHYIQLMCTNDYDEYGALDFCFYVGNIFDGWWHNPLLDVQHMKPDLFTKYQDITEFIITALNKNYYVFIQNTSFFTDKDINKKYIQPYFYIYGYNKVDNVLDIIGFNNLSNSSDYGTFNISIEEFNKTLSQWNQTDIFLFKLKNNVSYKFDISYVKEELSNYYYSINSSKNLRVYQAIDDKYVYGLKTYNRLEAYFQDLNNNIVDTDIRIPHILWEHKKCMLKRLNYINNIYACFNKDIIENYSKIERTALIIRNLFLKYMIVKNADIIDRLLYKFNTIKEDETILIKEIIECLEKY